MPDDRYFMQKALALAEKGRGSVSPNPMVGCVIVKSGKIIAEGWHKHFGGDHAEVDALAKAGDRAKGAVMYVTLEPCAHWGKTPPCVDAVLAAGIKKVVMAMVDPNKLTYGESVKRLRAAQVEVEVGVCEARARELNQSFIKRMTRQLPYVVAKTAQTLDGKIATSTGDSKWITSEGTRLFARNVRNDFDAILVGINTVSLDDPQLEAPLKRVKKVVVDSSLRLSEKAKLLDQVEPGQVIMAVTDKASFDKIRRLEKKGVCVILCPARDGRVDLKYLFKALAKKDIANLLIEGGAAVIGSALKAGLVDELNVYIAPVIIGDESARSSVVGMNILKVRQARHFHLTAVERIGEDLFLKLKV